MAVNQFWRNRALAIAQQYGIPPAIFDRLHLQESGYDDAVITGRRLSPAGAKGISQFMDATAREMGINPLDPEQALHGAAKYLLKNLQYFKGDWSKAVAAYNAGAGNVERAVQRGGQNWTQFLPGETQKYIQIIRPWETGQTQAKPTASTAAVGPAGRSFAQIKGTQYLSPEERTWFHQQQGTTPPPIPQSPPPGGSTMASPQQDTVAQGRFGVNYDQLTPQQRLAVDAVVKEIYGTSATQTPENPNANDRWTGTPGDGRPYGTYILGPDGKPQGDPIGNPQAPQNTTIIQNEPTSSQGAYTAEEARAAIQRDGGTVVDRGGVLIGTFQDGSSVQFDPIRNRDGTTRFNPTYKPASSETQAQKNPIILHGPANVKTAVDPVTNETIGTYFPSGSGYRFVPDPSYKGQVKAPTTPTTTSAPNTQQSPTAPPTGGTSTQQRLEEDASKIGTGRDYKFRTPTGTEGRTWFDPETNESHGVSGPYAFGPPALGGDSSRVRVKAADGSSVYYKNMGDLASGAPGVAQGAGSYRGLRPKTFPDMPNTGPAPVPGLLGLDRESGEVDPFIEITDEELQKLLPSFATGGNVVSGLRSRNPSAYPDWSGGKPPWGGRGPENPATKPYTSGQLISPTAGQTAADTPKGYMPYWQPNGELVFIDKPKLEDSYNTTRTGTGDLRTTRYEADTWQDRFGSGFWDKLTNPSGGVSPLPNRAYSPTSPYAQGGGLEALLRMLMGGTPGFAQGGQLMLDEPTVGIGLQSGQPQFLAGEPDPVTGAPRPEMMQITPMGGDMQQPMTANPYMQGMPMAPGFKVPVPLVDPARALMRMKV